MLSLFGFEKSSVEWKTEETRFEVSGFYVIPKRTIL